MAPWIAKQLRELLAQRGHAWLLQGPSGLGQYELGLALVRAWLCDRLREEGACGECESCHSIEVHAHTDLAVLMPETVMLQLGWPLSQKAQEAIDKKERKPSKDIRVEAMRDTVEFAQRTSGRGRGKAVLVYPAERMNHVTASALLKTLEEPPGDVRFVLASESAHQLLPTIRSRCLGHTLHWPDAQEARPWLVRQGVGEAAASALLRAAGGRPNEALRMHAAGVDALAWSQLPRALARGEPGALADWAPAGIVEAMQKVCHDVLAVGSGAAPRFFERADLPREVPLHAMTDWSKELAQAARTAEHPFNAGLMLEALVSRARCALNSGGPP
ncbi:MAG TPA: DNA polymerase III subunit delta' [Ramlibacter sp.]|uniref:DNA polymerase III subunit delta' n=1 Tax=Ramlibacter sp. TaxID=1917967 RepID=UPI002CA20927|nr:DNA polymerase III subunit delta' [Ramlibacter sp.]HVZ43607.1 DNA polymerase III subunit delta' [Ramlibacter sp.]